MDVERPMSIAADFIAVLQHNAGRMTPQQALDLVLAKARRHTFAEAGSTFIVRPYDGEPEKLEAMTMQNDAIQVDPQSFSMPIDLKSIAGYVAHTGESVLIDDLYNIPGDVPFTFNRSFDDKTSYRSKSMLAFPLKNFYGRVIGVVQLINHIDALGDDGKPLYEPFTLQHQEDMESLSTIIGAMVERIDLIHEIERLRKDSGEKSMKDTMTKNDGDKWS